MHACRELARIENPTRPINSQQADPKGATNGSGPISRKMAKRENISVAYRNRSENDQPRVRGHRSQQLSAPSAPSASNVSEPASINTVTCDKIYDRSRVRPKHLQKIIDKK